MIVIGCDFHPSFQQIAILDTECGTTTEHKLMHTSGEAERFYRALASPALVGIETVGNDQWFVQLLQRLGHQVWVGDAAQIRASYVRKQKTDRRDAFLVFGFQSHRCGIIVSCWFIAISWSRYVRASRTSSNISC